MKRSDITYGATALLLTLGVAAATHAKEEAVKPTTSTKSGDKASGDKTVGGKTVNPSDNEAKVTVVYDHVLPNVPGKSIKGLLVEYKPGVWTPCHTHPKSAFIYATVLEGEITSQVNNDPVVTYKKGQNFSEMPGDKHGVSKNASKTLPAKLLAVFVLDTNEKVLTTLCKE